MIYFTLHNKPVDTTEHRKHGTVMVKWCTEPFQLDSRENSTMIISPETCEDWDGGYYVVYPSDGSKPYAMSKDFFNKNYVPV